MKKTIFALFALLSTLSLAGEFKPLGEGKYEFTGPMLHADVEAYKALVLKEPSLTVTVDSQGGYLSAGVEMARVTLLYSGRVHLIAKECYSAAALWVSADPGFEYADGSSFLAYHLPWLSLGGTPAEQTTGETSEMAMDLFLAMYRNQGDRAVPLWRKMCDARDWGGINAFVVTAKDGSEKTGLWTSDGWRWQDGTASPATRLAPTPAFVRP